MSNDNLITPEEIETLRAGAKTIAHAILGDFYIMKKGVLNRNVIHFIKIVEDKCQK